MNHSTNQILGDTSQIKQDTDEILELLRRFETLRSTHIEMHGGLMMERFLDSLSSYAQSSVDPDEFSMSMDVALQEEHFASHQNNLASPVNPFSDPSTSPDAMRIPGGWNNGPMERSYLAKDPDEVNTNLCNKPWHSVESSSLENFSTAQSSFEALDSDCHEPQSIARPIYTSPIQSSDSLFSGESSNSTLIQKQRGDIAEFEITPISGSVVMNEEISTTNTSISSLNGQFDRASVYEVLQKDGTERPKSRTIQDESLDRATAFNTIRDDGTEISRPTDIQQDSLNEAMEQQITPSKSFKDEAAIVRARQSRATLSPIDRINIDRTLRKIDSETRVEEVLAILERGADPNANLEIYNRANNDMCAPALYHAVKHGNIACLEALLRFGAEPNCGSCDRRPLHIALRSSDIQATLFLLRAGADVSSHAVDLAVSTANVEMVKLILVHGATPDISSLTKAVSIAHIGLVKLLLEHGVSPNSSILDNAATGAHVELEIVKLLLENGSIPDGSTLATAVSERQVEVVEVLLKHGASPNSRILMNAVSGAHVEIVKLLLWHGAIPDSLTLEKAVSENQIDIVRLLLKHGAAPDKSILDNAAGRVEVDIVKLFLQHGATPCHSTMLKAVVLLSKARSNQSAQQAMSLIRLLFDYGINESSQNPRISWVDVLYATISSQTFYDDPQLTEFLHRAKVETLQRLLDQGVNVNSVRGCASDLTNHAPLECAIQHLEKEDVDVVALLLEYGANAKADDARVAPLDLAASRGYAETAQLLLKAGAELSLQSIPSHLEAAVQHNWVEMVELLTKADGSLPAPVTLLKTAIRNNNTTILALLLHASVEIEDLLLLLRFAVENSVEDAVDLLLKTGAKIPSRVDSSALHLAVGKNNTKIVNLVLKAYLPFGYEYRPHYDSDLLEVAVSNDNEAIVKLLLEAGVKIEHPELPPEPQNIARTLPTSKNRPSKIKEQKFAQIHRAHISRTGSPNGNYRPLLQIAAENNNKSMVALLLKAGSPVNGKLKADPFLRRTKGIYL